MLGMDISTIGAMKRKRKRRTVTKKERGPRGARAAAAAASAKLLSHVPCAMLEGLLKPQSLLAVALASRGLHAVYQRACVSRARGELWTALAHPVSPRDAWVRQATLGSASIARYELDREPFARLTGLRAVELRARFCGKLPDTLQILREHAERGAHCGDYACAGPLPPSLLSLIAVRVHESWLPLPSTLQHLELFAATSADALASEGVAVLRNLTTLKIKLQRGGGQPATLLRRCVALQRLVLVCAADTLLGPRELPEGLRDLTVVNHLGALVAGVLPSTLTTFSWRTWGSAPPARDDSTLVAAHLPRGLEVLVMQRCEVEGFGNNDGNSVLEEEEEVEGTDGGDHDGERRISTPIVFPRLHSLSLTRVGFASSDFAAFPSLTSLDLVAVGLADLKGPPAPSFFWARLQRLQCRTYFFQSCVAPHVSTALSHLILLAGGAEPASVVELLPPGLKSLHFEGEIAGFAAEPALYLGTTSYLRANACSSLVCLTLFPSSCLNSELLGGEVDIAQHLPHLRKLHFVPYSHAAQPHYRGDIHRSAARLMRWVWRLPSLESLRFGQVDATGEIGDAPNLRALRKLDLGAATRFRVVPALPPALRKLTVSRNLAHLCEAGLVFSTSKHHSKDGRTGTVSFWLD